MTSAAKHTASARAYSPERVEAGLAMYERANDARRSGDHNLYVRLTEELVAFNRETATLARCSSQVEEG